MATATGTIQMFAGTNAQLPAGWLPCDGSTRQTTQYPELATHLGQAGSSLFALPNLMDRLPVQSDGSDAGTEQDDALAFSQTIVLGAATFDSRDELTNAVVNASSTGSGSHQHRSRDVNPLLPRANTGHGGWWHGNGNNISHGEDPDGLAPHGADTGSAGAAKHTHRINMTNSDEGTSAHRHSFTATAKSNHSHAVTASNEQVTFDAGTGTATMPPRRLVVYMIKS